VNLTIFTGKVKECINTIESMVSLNNISISLDQSKKVMQYIMKKASLDDTRRFHAFVILIIISSVKKHDSIFLIKYKKYIYYFIFYFILFLKPIN
jgi:hypothetical protein